MESSTGRSPIPWARRVVAPPTTYRATLAPVWVIDRQSRLYGQESNVQVKKINEARTRNTGAKNFIEDAFAEVQSILKAERLKRERRTGLTTFVRELQRQLGQ